MPTRLSKSRRQRGSRTLGWGQVGQHRKSGMKGGRGKAGFMKHKWTWTVKYDKDHFGRDRFKPPRSSRVKKWMNVGQLDALFAKLSSERKKASRKTKASIDLVRLGYGKLLGAGVVKGSYKVRVKSFTEEAKAKVEAVGGEIVSVE